MNRIAKILSAVVSVTVALSIAIVMLTSALAATTATLSLNLASETEKEVVIEVKLEKGAFAAIDFGVEFDNARIKSCKAITANLPGGFAMTNPETGLVSGAATADLSTEGTVIATYTFEKVEGVNVDKADFSLAVSNCMNAAQEVVDAKVVNNIPVYVAPTEPSEEPTEPSEEPTEPSEEPTEPSEEPTEPSEEPTDAPTEAPTEKPADGDVVNPDTGDSVTATAAIFSLLAVSGAAIVALRKKED